MITLKTYENGTITAKDDAILYDVIIGESGILEGCGIKYLGSNKLSVASGRGVIKGRIFTISQQEIYSELSVSGKIKGRLLISMDLNNTENPILLKTQIGETLPGLEKNENCNYTNGKYEMEIAAYDINEYIITNLKETLPKMPDGLKKIYERISNVNNTADSVKRVSYANTAGSAANDSAGWNMHDVLVNLDTANKARAAELVSHKGSADHDGRYYTETEINSRLSAYQPASSAINTGNIGNQRVNYAAAAGSATNAGNVGGYDADNLLRRNGGELDGGQLNIRGSGRLYIPGAFCSNGLAQGVMLCGDKIWGVGDGGSYMSILANSGSWALTWFASDSRLKKDITDTHITALDFIKKIEHKKFGWKEEGRESVKVGYIAQQLEEIGMDVTFKVPQPKDSEYEELYQIDTTRLFPYVTKSIQEQQEQIEEQQEQIEILKQEITALKEGRV